MGRGRQKAKQTKVARKLKYQTFETDFDALAKELHGDDYGDESSDDDHHDPDPAPEDDWPQSRD